MADLRVKELNEQITEYETKVKAVEYDLRDHRKTLKTLREELKIIMDGKQGELL